MEYLDLQLMEKMCHPIAVAIFDKDDDPIAKFHDHDEQGLVAALNNPKQTFGGKELYPSLGEKAAILYYTLNKNHPFKNGNKRLATASLLVFLFINDYWIAGDRKEVEDYLVDLAQRVASTLGNELKDQIMQELVSWLKIHVIYTKESGGNNFI